MIDGVLYQKIETGLQLVSYPALMSATTYTVEEGTVRISAKAFENVSVVNAVLPSTLKAIGDKAFFGCTDLKMVVFKGYDAPILEEECDSSYSADSANAPYNKSYGGLGITDYFMWQTSGNITNYYYGANFVGYIGKLENKIVMVKPANGRNYDSFIFGQYFGTVVNGSNATMDATLAVIELISAIPADITLDDEATVVAARTAYDSLTSLDQKALVTNYSYLENAENTIEYLKKRNESTSESESNDSSSEESSSGGKTDSSAEESTGKKNGCKNAIDGMKGLIPVSVLAIAGVAFVLSRKKNNV